MSDQVAIYNPAKAMLAYKECNTPAKCVGSNIPRLAEIRKETSEKKALTVIELWISDLNDFLNISRKMNPAQMHQTAVMILADYYYFNIADINLVFTRAKKGHYGNLYESLDGMKIFSWFEQYDQERSQVAYNEALQEHDTIKSQNNELR